MIESLEGEVWKPVVGFLGYDISNMGRIRSYRKLTHDAEGKINGSIVADKVQRMLNPKPARNSKRPFVTFRVNGKRINKPVHSIVALAFLGPCPIGLETCHWDDDNTNNQVSNLRYDTRTANRLDAIRNGKTPSGENHCCATITDNEVAEIRELFAKGGITYTEVGQKYHKTKSTTWAIVNGKSRKKSGGPIKGIDY